MIHNGVHRKAADSHRTDKGRHERDPGLSVPDGAEHQRDRPGGRQLAGRGEGRTGQRGATGPHASHGRRRRRGSRDGAEERAGAPVSHHQERRKPAEADQRDRVQHVLRQVRGRLRRRLSGGDVQHADGEHLLHGRDELHEPDSAHGPERVRMEPDQGRRRHGPQQRDDLPLPESQLSPDEAAGRPHLHLRLRAAGSGPDIGPEPHAARCGCLRHRA